MISWRRFLPDLFKVMSIGIKKGVSPAKSAKPWRALLDPAKVHKAHDRACSIH